MASKTLEFRHLFVSSAVNENTITVFGEQGTVYQKGTDYDEMIEFHVSDRNLSNLIAYYNGNVPDGQYGSADMPSLISVNAPVSSIEKFNSGYQLLPNGTYSSTVLSKLDGKAGGKYNLGDVVMFSPNGDPDNASCWTCIRSTSIPGENAIPAIGTVDPSKVGTQYVGFYGTDRNGQNFLQGVKPATYDPATKVVTPSPYWSESAIAKSFQPTGNYYNNELAVYNGAVYKVRTTDGNACDPKLYKNENTTAEQEAAGVPATSVALAPNGAFGYDSVGSRYIQGVLPSGSGLSSFFWVPSSLPLVPVSTYTYINWDNAEVNSKLVYYDNNMPGGNGAQAFDTFTDDANDDITTLRKIYNDNEKGFVLDVAQSILSRIPAAAIKSQSVGQRPDPDSTLVEMVHSGPHSTAPNNYQPTVQGVFEEALSNDMLQVGGYKGTIVNYTVTDPSVGYTSVPNVRVSTTELATNPTLVPFGARAVARLGVDSVYIDKTHADWAGATGYQAGDDLTFVDDSNSVTKSFYIRATAEVYGVDALTGCITNVVITNPGAGFTSVPQLKDKNGKVLPFLVSSLKVVAVEESNSFTGFVNGAKVRVLYGSGQGATGSAIVQNGVLTGVNVTDGGSGYQSGEYKQDVVKLQGFDGSGAIVAAAVAPAVVTSINPVSGSIGATGLKLLVGGSGYSSEPSVIIDGPAVNSTATAGLTAGDRNIANVTNGGRYSSVPSALYGDSLNVYGGVTTVDITNRGAGYSVGDSLVFSGSGYAPASFTTSFANNAYSLSISSGGGGYNQGDELVLSDGTTGGDQLTVDITSCGGQVVSASFNPLAPFGSDYSVGSTFTTTEGVLFQTEAIGPSGQLLASTLSGVTGNYVGTGTTGYQVGDILIAIPKYYSVLDIDFVKNGTYYTAMPVITIDAPSTTDANIVKATATASATLCLGSFAATGDTNSSGGDVIEISQAGVPDSARLVVLSTDFAGHILTYKISDAGSGFDPALPVVIKSSNPDAILGTPVCRFTLSKITISKPGLGYTNVAVNVSLSNAAAGFPSQVSTATLWKSGGGGTFEITSLSTTGGDLRLLNPGGGYLIGDLIELGRSSGDLNGPVSGLYFNPLSSNLLSGNVLSAKVLSSPAGFTLGQTLNVGSASCVVSELSAADSISGVNVLKYVAGSARYANGISLQHKALTVATVSRVDISTGAVLSVEITQPGYGYTQLPASSISSRSGQNAVVVVPYLAVTRAEWISEDLFNIDDIDVNPPSAALPAQAVANITGSLYNLDLDAQRNPTLLSALENVKSGSTTGYAQAIPNLGVAAVTVQETGRNLGNYADLEVVFSAPDLDDGVTPTAVIDSSGFNASLKSVTYITVLNAGSGYTKPPSVTISNRTGVIPTVAAMLKPVMKLTGVSLKSRGLGFVNPPAVTISKPDYGSAVAPTAVTTLQARVQSFSVTDAGAHYSEIPNMTVVSQGTGARCTVSMGVSDIKIVKGGTGGFMVGDFLTFTGDSTESAEAVVSAVDSKGVITAVILNEKATSSGEDVHGNNVQLPNNSDFIGFGGKGYTKPPTVSSITRGVDKTLVSACGGDSQPAFSCRLGISQFEVTNAGTEFVCDGQVIVEPPPFAQDARYSAVVNAGNGTISSFAQIEAGYGYSTTPDVRVVGGGGSNAAATAVMGISDIFVADGGTGYALGDVVTIPCPAGVTASAVVTGLAGVNFTPVQLYLHTSPLVIASDGTVSSGGDFTGTIDILERGSGHFKDDIITLAPRVLPTQFSGAGKAVSFATQFFKVSSQNNLENFVINIPTTDENTYVPGDIFKVTVGSKSAYARLNWVNVDDNFELTGSYLNSTVRYGPFGERMIARASFNVGGPDKLDINWAVIGYKGARGSFGVNNKQNNYPLTLEFIEGWHEPMFTVLSSTGSWSIADLQSPVTLQIVDTAPVYPKFKVTKINDQTGGVLELELATGYATPRNLLSDSAIFEKITSKDSISYVQIVSPGSGYSTTVDSSLVTIKKADGTASSGSGAKLIPSLGVVGLTVANRGSGYTIAPAVYIDSPLHSSTAPQLYARSAEIATNGLVLLKQGRGYLPGGTYQLVPLATAGGLHQSGNVNNSVDTVLTLRTGTPSDFTTSQGMVGLLTQAAITNALHTVEGSNYRVGDILQLVPVGTTRSGSSATVRVNAVTSGIDTRFNPSGQFNGVPTNTGHGILDYGRSINGKDVGGYGSGYVSVPKVQILGGNQGVTTNCNIGVVGVDLATTNGDDQGSNYTVGDPIFSNSSEAGSIKIGEVTAVEVSSESTNGAITAWTIYQPYQSGLSRAPTISVQRRSIVPGSKDANLIAVMGITNVTIVTNASGFVGDAVVRVDPPYGSPSATVTPRAAYIVPTVEQEVATITFQEVVANNPALYTKLPTISIASPPGLSRFLGWFGVRFNPKDAFEFIIQYTIAKAIAFQVDQDASLPGYYFVADSITIGGVTIPLRQPGGAGAQGREMSANRIIRKYMVRMIAV